MTTRAVEPGNGEQSPATAHAPTRVVVDTNVWLRYLIKPSAAFIQAAEGRTLLETIRALAEFTPALGPVPVFTRDPKDDKFIACALAAQARFVITTDEDLLVVDEVGGVRMITPYQFIAWLRQTPNETVSR